MARTPSTMLPLGSKLPQFSLTDGLQGPSIHAYECQQQNGLLVMFICNHCPFVLHVKDELKHLAAWLESNEIGVVAINSNDVQNYPDDAPAKMTLQGYAFPYLFDEDQSIAKAFKAACTPDFYLFDAHGHLFYRGQLDDSRPGNEEPVDGHSIREAVQAMLNGQQADSVEQKPSLGCNIKWKEGHAPNYFGV
jgi:hypothetical protein